MPTEREAYTTDELIEYLRRFWRAADGVEYGHEHEVMKCAADELERLRDAVQFTWLWTNRESANLTDAERVSVIKHHPTFKNWTGAVDGQ